MLTEVYSLCCIALAVGYAGVLAAYRLGWRRLETWQVPTGYRPRARVTVLLPARNEGTRLAECLEAVLATPYPRDLLEVLVIDDWSEDNTASIAETFAARGPVRLIRLSEMSGTLVSGKKGALAAGVQAAGGELIVTTDADCVVSPQWLMLLVSFYETRQPGAVTGPVLSHREKGLLSHFQALDLAGLALVTGAGLRLGWQRMGNGASLCFARSTFLRVGGYSGNEALASGDDLFLLQKIAQTGRPVCFLKNPEAVVCTETCPDWASFLQQRLRWGTKNSALPETPIRLVLALTLLFHCTLLANLALFLWAPAWGWASGVQLLLKALADYRLLRESCRYFGRRELMRWFVPALLMHTAYIAGAGLLSLFFTRYTWKGRLQR